VAKYIYERVVRIRNFLINEICIKLAIKLLCKNGHFVTQLSVLVSIETKLLSFTQNKVLPAVMLIKPASSCKRGYTACVLAHL